MRVIRVTHDGQYRPRLMSYWANAFVSLKHAYVFAGHNDGSPRFFRVDLTSGAVEELGSLVPYPGETEGWHWRQDGKLYVMDGPRLRVLDPFNLGDNLVVMDIEATFPGCHIWQPHSSDDGRVLSATVQQNEGGRFGTMLVTPSTTSFYAATALDESQVSRDGAYLLIKEADDNRIITVATGDERVLTDAQGALGHSDCGHGFAVGENNQIGACVYLNLGTLEQRPLFSMWNMGYVSVRGDRCLHSSEAELRLIDLHTGAATVLLEHGGGTDYDDRVKASLSPCGRVATYMVNRDVYLVELPQ